MSATDERRGTEARTPLGKAGVAVDERLGAAKGLKGLLSKVFPDHWSFMLGEIALFSFIMLLLSGTYLTFFFKPSMTEVVYDGSYVPLNGIRMSEAFSSSLDISFDIRGGLLMRQTHHWAALLFVAAMTVHMFRVFFTGAFRKPRETNWLLGIGLLTLGLLEGFSGYSLPDDLLSGTGLRIAEGIVQSIPVIGTYLAMFVFGGEFPGDDFIPRLYSVHILLIPGLILGLVAAHLLLVFYNKHTQYPGPGKTEQNVVGYPFMPIYMAKAGGFSMVVFGVLVLLGAVVQVNPIWIFGPYNPSQITAGSQPDWYIGFLDGMLRIFPPLETSIWGYTISWNVFLPAVVLPGVLFTLAALYPFIEAWITGDRREHHLLDRPRNQPTRTALGVTALVFYLLLLLGGGNDIIATRFDLSVNQLIWFVRISVLTLPGIAFIVTRRICIGLQRRDRDRVLHGRETGIIQRLPHGEYIEVHAPIDPAERETILAAQATRPQALETAEEFDENGVAAPGGRLSRARVRLSQLYYGHDVPTPTAEELTAADAHLAHVDGEHALHGADEHEALPAGDPAGRVDG